MGKRENEGAKEVWKKIRLVKCSMIFFNVGKENKLES